MDSPVSMESPSPHPQEFSQSLCLSLILNPSQFLPFSCSLCRRDTSPYNNPTSTPNTGTVTPHKKCTKTAPTPQQNRFGRSTDRSRRPSRRSIQKAITIRSTDGLTKTAKDTKLTTGTIRMDRCFSATSGKTTTAALTNSIRSLPLTVRWRRSTTKRTDSE